jgi:predicted ATPase/DNA-binding CsgD family transcriptional regulator
MLTLSGPGGIGKTRLALRTLHALADDFPDGARYVELADLASPDLVVTAVAAALGVTEEQGRPLLDTLADALRPRRMLLALDNCEHLLEECARVCHRLLTAAPDVRLLTTSREALRVAGETVWPVPPLPVSPQLSDAVRLFTERAAAALPSFTLLPSNAEPAAEICRRLDGIPLAIELAAARVRALSVPQILDRLTDRFALLTTGDRVAPPRQRTLRGAIDWSHSLLDGAERIVLRRLSVFAVWSLEMAEFVCADASLPADGVLDLIAALVDKSLVVREPDAIGQARYRMLDTIRAYALEKLAEAGETAVFRGRLREYVLAVVEHNFAVGMAIIPGSWRERVEVFLRYDVDASNAWLVLGQCLADGDLETGLRICTAILPCMLVRGEFAQGCEWTDAFLGAPGIESVPLEVRGAALIGRAQLTISLDPAAAEVPARAGFALCEATDDAFWTAAGLSVLSEICGHTGRTAEAESLGRDALALARASGDRWGEGWALAILAVIAGLQGTIRRAADLAADSLRVMREIDHYWGLARAQLVLANMARLRADHTDARERYLEALVYLRELDARPDIARCLSGLGRVALDLGDTDTARDHLAESLRLARATGSRIGVARGLESFASLALRTAAPDRAILLAAASASLRETAGLPPIPSFRVARYLSAASGPSISPPGAARTPADPNALWSQGRALTSEAAITLALAPPTPSASVSSLPTALSPPSDSVPLPVDSAAPLSGSVPSPSDSAAPSSGSVPSSSDSAAPSSDSVPSPPSGSAAPSSDSVPSPSGVVPSPVDSVPFPAGSPPSPADAVSFSSGTAASPSDSVSSSSDLASTLRLSGHISDISGFGTVSLTPREMEIAALVASGRSNKAIAGVLYISPATVARHIANIMHKLGFSTRTQIATWILTRNP